MFTSIVEVHRSGRPTGRTFAVAGDPWDENHPDHWQVKMGNWETSGPRGWDTFEEAQAFADSLVEFDEDGWAGWAG
jgi:hypothetical protein